MAEPLNPTPQQQSEILMQALPHMLRYDDAIVVVNGNQAIEKVESPTDSRRANRSPSWPTDGEDDGVHDNRGLGARQRRSSRR